MQQWVAFLFIVRFIVPFWLYPKGTTAKEVMNMKAATVYRQMPNVRRGAPYPNAASRREVLHRFVDFLLVGAIGIAFAALVLFMPVLA